MPCCRHGAHLRPHFPVILNDNQIRALSEQGMIKPYQNTLVRQLQDGRAVLSFGPSSYGYDLCLSAREFLIFRHIPGTVVDPKAFNPKNLEQKYTAVIGCYRNLRAAGFNVHLINHKDPHPQLLSIIKEFENA